MKTAYSPMHSRLLPLANAVIVPLLIGNAGAVVIDTFSDGSLSEYTSTRVLDNSVATANVAFSSSSGSLVSTYDSGASAAEQVLLLRNDFSLAVGQTLTIDTAFATTGTQMDFGLAISGAAAITSASSGDTDTRDLNNFLAIYVRPSQDAVRVTSSNNGVVTTGSGVLATVETLVSQLYITRVTSTQFTVGYTDTSAVSHDALTVSFTATDLGSTIGFYSDMRTASTSLGSLDNLTIVPEPSAALLGGLGLFALLRRRRG
jgi:hypothetical protein